MNLEVKIEGLDNIHKATQAMRDLAAKEVRLALAASGERVRGEAIKSILEGGKSGRVYKRGNIIHKASAQGEAPANDTGRLAGSISTYPNGTEQTVVAGRGLAKYARLLEFGTSKMGERPFLQPALEKSKAWIIKRLNDAVVRAAMKSVKK
jgi:HK97 gp10 family phage protein